MRSRLRQSIFHVLIVRVTRRDKGFDRAPLRNNFVIQVILAQLPVKPKEAWLLTRFRQDVINNDLVELSCYVHVCHLA